MRVGLGKYALLPVFKVWTWKRLLRFLLGIVALALGIYRMDWVFMLAGIYLAGLSFVGRSCAGGSCKI